MIGVNIDTLEQLLKNGNSNLDSFYINSNNLVNCIKELNSCYSGNSLSFLFSEPINKINDIKTIHGILENYFDILKSVKDTYQQQDELFKTQINHINSKI